MEKFLPDLSTLKDNLNIMELCVTTEVESHEGGSSEERSPFVHHTCAECWDSSRTVHCIVYLYKTDISFCRVFLIPIGFQNMYMNMYVL